MKRYDDIIPINIFIKDLSLGREFRDLVGGWPVAPETIVHHAQDQLKEVGIFFIKRDDMYRTKIHVFNIITRSSYLKGIIKKARKEEAAKKRSRVTD
jgi:hypothetical protein